MNNLRIQSLAQKEKAVEFYQAVVEQLEFVANDSPGWEEKLRTFLDKLRPACMNYPSSNEAWDFSREKGQAVFVQDENIIIRPIVPSDEDFYHHIRMQYSIVHQAMLVTSKEGRKRQFLKETLSPETFFCVIELSGSNTPIGYLGIKDTTASMWEVAIELDMEYVHNGFGSQSIRLFLNHVCEITCITEYRAKVEVDNIPSQGCFEKLGGTLVGLCDGPALKCDDEKKSFEERHMELIDDRMIVLADILGVEPRKILSHVLDYRLSCPL